MALTLPAPCPFCSELVQAGDVWDVDHAVPRSADPARVWDPANLRPAHARCNRAAGARLAVEAGRLGRVDRTW